MKAVAILLALAPCVAFGQTVYKCKASDGTTVYAQQPCGKEAEVLEVKGQGVPSEVTTTLDPEAPSLSRLSSIITVLDSVAIDGRDCEWALKVSKDYAKCNRFTKQITEPGSRWNLARRAYGELLNDEPFANANMAEMQRALALIQESTKYAGLYAERGRR